MKIFILIIVLFCIENLESFANEISSTNNLNDSLSLNQSEFVQKQKFGICLISSAGTGFAYNRKLSEKIAVEIVGLYFSDNWFEPDYRSKSHNYGFGLEFQKIFLDNDNFEIYYGLGVNFSRSMDYEKYLLNWNDYYTFGIGFGISYKISQNFQFNLKPIFIYRESNTNQIDNRSLQPYHSAKEISEYRNYNFYQNQKAVIIGLGLYYTF